MAVESIALSGFYEEIIENAESNILILDENFNIVTLNQGFYWLFLEAFDLELKRGVNLFHRMDGVLPEISLRWKKRCTSALEGLAISDAEDFNYGGHMFSWKIFYKRVSFANQKYISIFSRNITASRLFQSQLMHHQATLRTVINALPASVALLNASEELIDFNARMYHHFLSAYDIHLNHNGKILDFFSTSQHDIRLLWREKIELTKNKRESVSFLLHQMKGGTEAVLESRITPILNDGHLIGLSIFIEDITRKSVDEHLQRTQVAELVKLNAELDRFVYSASHDLRAPLLSIMGVVNLMKREAVTESPYLKHIESSIRRLDNFVTDIINYSRNNRLEIVHQPIDIEALLEHAKKDLSYLDGVNIVKCIECVSSSAPFFSDADRLLIILRNLMSNAFQYYDRWKNPYLLIDVDVNEHLAIIRLEDNGIGIKESFTNRVFDMFFRASDKSNGAGLGLYIVKNAVEKLGGNIKIQSTVGVGTIISISLPNQIGKGKDTFSHTLL